MTDPTLRRRRGDGASPPEQAAPNWEGFVREMFSSAHDRGDWDGGTIQDVAEKHGVLIRTAVTEPCDPEHCPCAEVDDFPLECFRLPPAAGLSLPVVQVTEAMVRDALVAIMDGGILGEAQRYNLATELNLRLRAAAVL